jgi:hypothetical protein
MTLQLLHSEFPYTVNEANLIFFISLDGTGTLEEDHGFLMSSYLASILLAITAPSLSLSQSLLSVYNRYSRPLQADVRGGGGCRSKINDNKKSEGLYQYITLRRRLYSAVQLKLLK